MIKKLYDKCVAWAGYKYAKQILAIEAFVESSFFPIPPDVMIVPMVVSKKNEFIHDFNILSVQRNLKIIGIFSRLFKKHTGESPTTFKAKVEAQV